MRTHTHPYDYQRRPVLPSLRIREIENAILRAAMIKYGIIVEPDECHAAIIPAEEKHAAIVEGAQE